MGKRIVNPVLKDKTLHIESRALGSIHPYHRNAKKHPPAQVAKLAKVIEEHGFDVPIVVDAEGVIIKGHGRLLAAQKLGLTHVPVIVRTDLSPAQVRGDFIRTRGITVLVARRCMPEIFSQEEQRRRCSEFATMLRSCGVAEVFLQGRNVSRRAKHPVSSIQAELQLLDAVFAPGYVSGECAYLVPHM